MSFRHASPLKSLSAAVLLTLSIPAFAQAPVPAAGATPAPGAAPAAAPSAPGAPRPFKDIVKDAKEIPGLFKLYQKDEKVWIEIKPEQFDKPFYFTYNIPQSVGERGLYGSQMGGGSLVAWKKIGNQIQLIEKNTEFYAKPGSPQAQFVSESFSDSLLASAATASLPHPDSKAVIVEVSGLLFSDIPGYLTRLEAAYRMPFALDARNTSVARVNNTDAMTGVQVSAHFSVPKLSAPPLVPSPVPTPPPPQATPDPRSMFVSFYYSFAELPANPMASRPADERVGHFTTSRVDYSDDVAPKTREHIVNRWRLEKKDPAAAVSEPKEPIVYWVDKNVPEKYRKSVTDGILEWNKAFEKAGFKNAVVVKQQTEKDDFDTMDLKHASVRWFTGADVGFAIGPSRVDPRSGEILDADIGMSDVFGRGARRMVAEDIGKPTGYDANIAYIMDPLKAHKSFLSCNYMGEAAHELHFAMDLLEARGLDMESPEADAVAQAYVKDVIMHEVGHTLGLRHNFLGSTVYSLKDVQNPEFTKKNGITTSVMEYTPFNLAAKGEKQGEYSQSVLGPYDYWAIEYAYKPLDAKTEKADLAKIADRSATDKTLAYATDEDAGFGNLFIGMDPDANRFDLGSDPLAYYKKRMQLSREIWDRIQTMQLKPGESYERLTRSLASGFAQLARVAPLAAKYVGGVAHHRDRAGASRPLYEPTPVARQREALALITNDFFKVDSFKFKPEFVSRIGIDHLERTRGQGIRNPDVSISVAVLNVQRAVLDQLMADDVAARLLSSQEKLADQSKALKLSDMYDSVQGAIWSEVKSGHEISSMRRNLQREHLRRVADSLVRPSAAQPADARALKREAAVQLQADIRKAVANPKLSKESRAHLNESLNTLSEALKAQLTRASV
jgi:hypothetical protein